ncbi:MAG: hypothetical protein AAGM40_07270 [Cyanobacteria bacterium J06573_2]
MSLGIYSEVAVKNGARDKIPHKLIHKLDVRNFADSLLAASHNGNNAGRKSTPFGYLSPRDA